MKPLTLNDLKSLEDYEAMRPQFLKYIIDLRKRRRVAVGDKITISFENRDTVLFQIQEMARAERLTKPSELQHELDTYNPLIPSGRELKGTLFIEITDRERIREVLDQLHGLDEKEVCFLELGEEQIPIEFEGGHSKEDRISAVHYITIRFSGEQERKWKDPRVRAVIAIEHRNYRARAEIPQVVRQELAKDLAEEHACAH